MKLHLLALAPRIPWRSPIQEGEKAWAGLQLTPVLKKTGKLTPQFCRQKALISASAETSKDHRLPHPALAIM